MRFAGTLTGLLTLAVVIGVLFQLIKSPKATTAIALAGADTVDGIIHGLEGK